MSVPAQSVPYEGVPYDTDLAQGAALIADPTRAAMLRALMSGRPLAAGELARLAGVSAATASFHLAKLLEGNLITVARQGRHRYYRLAGHEVAAALEAIGLISPDLPVRTLRQSREAAALAEARNLLRPPGGPGRGRASRRHARPGPAGGTRIFGPNGPW